MKTFETDRLILRCPEIEDAPVAFENWCSDPEVCKYLTWPPHENVDVTKKIISNWIEENNKEDNQQKTWVIVYKPDNQVIGTIACVEYKYTFAKRAELGYCISRRYWGKGIVTEAMNLLVPYYLYDLDTYRVQAKHDTDNPASGKVMMKAGLEFEGILKGYSGNFTNPVCDVAIYGITQKDYKNGDMKNGK